MRRLAVWAILLVLGTGSAVRSQSLGEIAAREKERREQAKKSGAKAYGEDDLKKPSKGTYSAPSGEASAPQATGDKPAADAAKGEKAAKTPEEQKAEAQKAWADKLQKARQEVAELNTRIEQIQTELNDLSGPLYGSGRANSADALEKAKASLAAKQQEIAAAEEEGRRAGFR